jgi:hypothetical protein
MRRGCLEKRSNQPVKNVIVRQGSGNSELLQHSSTGQSIARAMRIFVNTLYDCQLAEIQSGVSINCFRLL